MFQRFFVPAITAVTLCAQQAIPNQTEAEKALRERVQQFYQLQVDKKYRQAEAYVAEDTKDLFYASGKPDIPSFKIVKVVMLDNGTKAEVTVTAKLSVFMMGKGVVPMDLPTTGTWKIENGQWVWFVDQSAGIKTPFGVMKPADPGAAPAAAPDLSEKVKSVNLAGIVNQVSVEPAAVELSADKPVQSATVTNSMPGEVQLRLETNFIQGIDVKLEKTKLNAGEKANVIFEKRARSAPSSGVTKVVVSPLELILEVRVTNR